MLVRIALLLSFAAAPWIGVGSAAGSRTALDDEEPQTSECGAAMLQGPSFDDPNVDTDPDRPVTELASLPDEQDGDDQGDDASGGSCTSESELQFQIEPDNFVEASLLTPRTLS